MPMTSDQRKMLAKLLKSFSGVSITVIGDLMLDEYVAGAVERISPEAPVPVLRARSREYRLGGAANVAQQVAALGAKVSLVGVIGDDEAGERLRALCDDAGIATEGLLKLAGRPTTRKLRLLGQAQQLLRVDWEDDHPYGPAQATSLIDSLKNLPSADAVIFSDYAKGVITPAVIAAVLNQLPPGTPVVTDPKQRDFAQYRGATYLTPNLRELSAAMGTSLAPDDRDGIIEAARAQNRLGGFTALIVTLGDRGMLIVPSAGEVISVPAMRQAVYDVTGAGDTATAVLATGLATGATLEHCVQIANLAAGLSVAHVGTVAIGREALRDALIPDEPSKLVSRETLATRVRAWQDAGERVVFTNGCFDLLHPGHLSLLQFAKSQGDRLVLAINSDAAVRRLKGPSRPVVSEADRAALLGALSCVDLVLIFDEDTPLETIRLVRPQVLVKGQDYTRDSVVGREFVEAHGGRLILAPLVPDYSTTQLIARARA